MKEGENLEVSFRFKNTGTKPLVISNVTGPMWMHHSGNS